MSILQSGVLPAVAIAIAAAIPAHAQTASNFLAGKTVSVFSSSPPGGSFHLYCDTLARNIGKYLPGEPTVIVQHKTGGGGAVLAAYMANVAPKDGTMIAMVAPGSITDARVRNLKYDPLTFRWLGSAASRAQMIALWHTSPVKTVDDLKKTEVVMAAGGRSDATYVVPAVINAILGTKMKIITSYKGGGDMNLAVERGEVSGRSNYYSGFASVHPTWITENKIRFVIGLGPTVPELPNLPNVRDYVKAGTIESKLLDLVDVNFIVGQAFYLPPETPDAYFVAMRKAFADTMADPAAEAEFKKRQLDFRPLDGAKIEELVAGAMKAAEDTAVMARLREIMGVKL